jgi:fructose/tagatose bisphosphate aldolase
MDNNYHTCEFSCANTVAVVGHFMVLGLFFVQVPITVHLDHGTDEKDLIQALDMVSKMSLILMTCVKA